MLLDLTFICLNLRKVNLLKEAEEMQALLHIVNFVEDRTHWVIKKLFYHNENN
jgi:hypothetical protein